jgi:hypothetical protein
MSAKVMTDTRAGTETLSRILREGYGPGAWHGPDMAAAIADVTSDVAYQRPGAGRHNIAEIVVHHAWTVRNVVGSLTGDAPAFPLEGEDWFELSGESDLSWADAVALLDGMHAKLNAAIAGGRTPGDGSDPLDIVLGVTCHAVYHAGQIQLVKLLIAR